MLSIGSLHKHSPNYLLKGDYYAKEGARPGFWFGAGAEAKHLAGEVFRDTFLRLCEGLGPSGEKLVQNGGLRDLQGVLRHHPGWDLTYSPPKSVSALWSQSSPRVRAWIEEALIEAVRVALRYLEKNALFTRTGKGGSTREKAEGMIAACFLHDKSRADQPQLHLHCAVMNVVLSRDGKFRTMHGITSDKKSSDRTHSRLPFFDEKMTAGALFQASLAEQLEKRLNLRTVRSESGFEVEGVPAELCERFSSRRQAIVEELARRGKSDAKTAEKVARLTRQPKRNVSREELFKTWRAMAEGFDLSAVYAPREPRDLVRERASVESAVREELAAHKGPIRRSTVVQAAARQAQGRGVDAEATLATARKVFGEKNARPVRDMDAERSASLIEKIFRRSRSRGEHRLGLASVLLARKQVEFIRHQKFSPADRNDLSRITRARGDVQVLSTGREKPRYDVLSAARIAWERQGFRVLGVSPGQASAGAYSEQTGMHCITLTGLLRGLVTNRGLLRGYLSALKKSINLGLAGFPTKSGFLKYAVKASGKWIKFSEKSVVVLDNVRAIPLPVLADILRRAHKARAKVVLLDFADGAAQTRNPLAEILAVKQHEADLARLVREAERNA